MGEQLKYYSVTGLNGRMVYVFKLASGSLQSWIAAKAQSCLRAGDYVPDIVVMEGEPDENPNLFGSPRSIPYIRSILTTLNIATGIRRCLISKYVPTRHLGSF